MVGLLPPRCVQFRLDNKPHRQLRLDHRAQITKDIGKSRAIQSSKENSR